MKLSDILKTVECINSSNITNVDVTGVKYDSRKITTGDIFVAVKGFVVDGNDYIDSAIKAGARAIVSDNLELKLESIPLIIVSNARKALSDFSIAVYGIDFDKLFTIAVTGTNGKTTTASLYYNLIRELFSVESVAMFGTVEYVISGKSFDALRTTPESSDLIGCISKSDSKCEGFVMEVASHALELSRIDNFKFDIAVWSNLTQDHLDFHKTMENYYQAKKKLFLGHVKSKGVAVINIDDEFGKRLSQELPATNVVTYGRDSSADVSVADSQSSWQGIKITVVFKNEKFVFNSPMVGDFNIYNITSFIAGALAKGVDKSVIESVLENTESVRGRMERLNTLTPFNIIVDYAHTPDALMNVLDTARKLTSGKLITVFGCGGDRDRGKRPLMGKAVAKKSDMAIVTTDNPRCEKPSKIVEDILDGIPLDFYHTVVLDRYEAIQKAFEEASSGDCVVIAGKGHEDYQEIDGVKYSFDDVKVALEISKKFELNE